MNEQAIAAILRMLKDNSVLAGPLKEGFKEGGYGVPGLRSAIDVGRSAVGAIPEDSPLGMALSGSGVTIGQDASAGDPDGAIQQQAPPMAPSHEPTFMPERRTEKIPGGEISVGSGFDPSQHSLSPTGTGESDMKSALAMQGMRDRQLEKERIAAANRMVNIGTQTGNQQLVESGKALIESALAQQAGDISRDTAEAQADIGGREADARMVYSQAEMEKAKALLKDEDPIKQKLGLLEYIMNPMISDSLGIKAEDRGKFAAQILMMKGGDLSGVIALLTGGETGEGVEDLDSQLLGE